jgi:hypothetical protein
MTNPHSHSEVSALGRSPIPEGVGPGREHSPKCDISWVGAEPSSSGLTVREVDLP